MAVSSIGRFKVGKTLGSGNQGTVYLCSDPELQRRVAIKLLDKQPLGSEEASTAFHREARSMSKIQHPNIVSIYEAGRHEGLPYLVFEYVEGRLLSELIHDGKLDVTRSLKLFQGLLEGMQRAHQQGIVHRDLKPANIIISNEGVPKVMDFGIARMLSGQGDPDTQLIGSPRYMAPEYVEKGEVSTKIDVFALGLILDEMLTGMPVFPGNDPHAVLDSIVRDPVAPPSRFNPAVDERLDRVVLKALEKDPGIRYQDAGELLQALRDYQTHPVDPKPPATGEGSGTLEFLLRRMQRKNDFPALAQSIRTLNAMADTSDKSVSDMSKVIVKDFALTNKILKVVNSAYFGNFSGKVGTISRAVVLIGMQPIRALAASLIFFDHLHDKAQAQEMKAQITAALYSAVLASNLAGELDPEKREEYFISAMLQNLGRILVTYYLHEEAQEISRLLAQQGMAPLQAQRTVLGITFEEVGIGIARQWNFPEEILYTLKALPEDAELKSPKTLGERRRLVAGFANDTAVWIGGNSQEDAVARNALMRRYGKVLNLDAKRLGRVLGSATKEFLDLIGSAAAGTREDPFVQRLQGRIEAAREHKGAGREPAPGDISAPQSSAPTLIPGATPVPAERVLAEPPRSSDDREALLTEGLQEVTGLLLNQLNLSQLCSVVLETMYRAMAFQRALLCLRDRSGRFVEAKIGFGEGVDVFLKGFRFPMEWEPDVFHAALKNGVDVHISNTHESRIQGRLPSWFTRLGDMGAFLVFPLVVKERPIGLIYGDYRLSDGLQMTPKTLNLLKTLRNQIVLGLHGRA